MRNFSSLLLIATAACSLPATATDPTDIQTANIFHAYNWKFSDIAAELDRIADAGYGAVQVSPVQGNCAENAEWYYAYMPYDFSIGNTTSGVSSRCNGNGNREDLRTLCSEANARGIQIIVDVVANHVNPSNTYCNKFWRNGQHQRDNGGVNYSSRKSIITGNIGDYKDVISEEQEVRDRAVSFVEDLKSLGVSGIRWDAAKHIGLPSENCDFWTDVTGVEGLWHYGEILDNPAGSISSSWTLLREYTTYMSVTDNAFCQSVLNSFDAKSLPTATGGHTRPASEGKAGISGDKVVLWAESHDTFSNNGGSSKYKSQDAVDRAYVYVACRDKETALYFSRPNDAQGNPVKGYSQIRMGCKGSVNGLENPVIKAVNNFRKAMSGRADCVTIGAGVASVTRDGGGAVLILPTEGEKTISAANGNGYLPAGTYTDVLSGNKFTVTSSTISGNIGQTGVAVIDATGSLDSNDILFSEKDTDNRNTEYFNLQGMRVEIPTQGLYIKRTGTSVEKILIP
ncbi:MAG: hypothetical protein K1V76_08665 [Candidatus Amulumruptor sp.]